MEPTLTLTLTLTGQRTITITMEAELREAFSFLDTNGDGQLDVSEIRAAAKLGVLEEAGLNAWRSNSDLRDFMCGMDDDGSGTIDFPEFLKMATAAMRQEDDYEKYERDEFMRQDLDRVRETYQQDDRYALCTSVVGLAR